MANDVTLGNGIKNTLLSLNRSSRTIENVVLRLATGQKINAPQDNPQNFFTAQALNFKSQDLQRLLTGIDKSIRTIEGADYGARAISDLVDQAESIVEESKIKMENGEDDLLLDTITTGLGAAPLNEVIELDAPVAYWRLNDAGATVVNRGSSAGIDGTYVGAPTQSQSALYTNGGSFSTQFDGTDDGINIPDSVDINNGSHSQRTIEMVFRADSVAGRQTLYKEGGGSNNFAIYIDNGSLYIYGRDDDNWESGVISTPISADTTYHVALVYDQSNSSFTGYLDGNVIGAAASNGLPFPVHGADISIGYSVSNTVYHDGADSSRNWFDGRISDVAIYNSAISNSRIALRADSMNQRQVTQTINTAYEDLIQEIDQITQDAHYLGINLLKNDNLLSTFNTKRTHTLLTEGTDFTREGLGIRRLEFTSVQNLNIMLDSIRAAKDEIESFIQSLSIDLNIIEVRARSINESILTHKAGADDLTVSDANEDGAELLASQTRQNLGMTALSLAAQSQTSVLSLFG